LRGRLRVRAGGRDRHLHRQAARARSGGPRRPDLAEVRRVRRRPGAGLIALGSGYLWIKAFHIVFMTSWFAGLFYLPRIFVNLAMVDGPGAERDRLLLMAGKLWRFMQPLMLLAIALGLWLWLGYGVGAGAGW